MSIGNDFGRQKTTMRFGCFPLIFSLIVLMVLKLSGVVLASWWMIVLIPTGIYVLYIFLCIVFFLIMYLLTSSS